MNRRDACLALTGAMATLACTPRQRARPASLLIGGAAAMQPLTAALAQAYLHGRDDLDLIIERGGSLPAYIAARRGAIDLAAMTRPLSDAEDDASAHHYLIARSHLRIVVNRASPLSGLGSVQLVAALTGAIGNWRELGGANLPVSVHAERRGSAGRQAAEQLLLDGRDFTVAARESTTAMALALAVAADPAAIGYLAGHIDADARQLRVLDIDGVPAAPANVLSGRYPCTHGYYLQLHGAPGGERQRFVEFARSAAGQAVVRSCGLLAVC